MTARGRIFIIMRHIKMKRHFIITASSVLSYQKHTHFTRCHTQVNSDGRQSNSKSQNHRSGRWVDLLIKEKGERPATNTDKTGLYYGNNNSDGEETQQTIDGCSDGQKKDNRIYGNSGYDNGRLANGRRWVNWGSSDDRPPRDEYYQNDGKLCLGAEKDNWT